VLSKTEATALSGGRRPRKATAKGRIISLPFSGVNRNAEQAICVVALFARK